MAPFDKHNEELLANVHPDDWTNPEPRGRYNIVAIGAGTAGLVSAAGAAGLGARAAVIERHLMGGDCLNVGCVPSKGVISAARAWHAARRAGPEFGGPTCGGDDDFGVAMRRMRRLRAGISHHDSAERFAHLGVDVYLGQARFTGSDTLEVGGRQLRFRRAVIATGGRAAAPPIPGLDEIDYLTNETVFSLTHLPARFGVIGGGPIGCELAQSLARFGSRVTLFDMADHVLPREDPDAAGVVQESLVTDGVELILKARIDSVASTAGDTKAVRYELEDGVAREIEVDALLVAVGRKPNVEDLGLDEAGVKYGSRGIEVDDFLRTSNRRVYACGDVASRYQFTHTADAQARIVIQNALFFGRARASKLVVPWCTYTSPEIAHVGMYEADARAVGHDVSTITIPLSEVDRAVLDGEDSGFLRVHHEKGRILGATMVAEHAGDMIGELALAITAGVGLSQISGTIHPYPTQAEIIRKVGDAYRRTGLTPLTKRLLGIWFRLFG
ncbi:MAG TPA: mercuric reductase [Acidobacteriota bacterium]|nr:mercuric reductase [Acidobacteriota bacterium]